MTATHSVLIVDDEPAVLFTLQVGLQQAGYLVTAATTACEALNVMQPPNAYDAVVTDLHMETAHSGFEVAQAAARLHPRPVIIVLTGYASDDNARAAIGGPVDHIEFKPFGLGDFKRVLHRLLALRDDRLQRC